MGSCIRNPEHLSDLCDRQPDPGYVVPDGSSVEEHSVAARRRAILLPTKGRRCTRSHAERNAAPRTGLVGSEPRVAASPSAACGAFLESTAVLIRTLLKVAAAYPALPRGYLACCSMAPRQPMARSAPMRTELPPRERPYAISARAVCYSPKHLPAHLACFLVGRDDPLRGSSRAQGTFAFCRARLSPGRAPEGAAADDALAAPASAGGAAAGAFAAARDLSREKAGRHVSAELLAAHGARSRAVRLPENFSRSTRRIFRHARP
jgi:hypothetical protein